MKKERSEILELLIKVGKIIMLLLVGAAMLIDKKNELIEKFDNPDEQKMENQRFYILTFIVAIINVCILALIFKTIR